MERLIIEETDESPGIIFDRDTRDFILTGKSLPEDAVEFYEPVVEWIETYAKDPLPKTNIEFKMEYFNTASSKMVLDLLIAFEAIQLGDNGCDVLVRWHFEEDDEDMEDSGIDFADVVEIPFEMCSHSS